MSFQKKKMENMFYLPSKNGEKYYSNISPNECMQKMKKPCYRKKIPVKFGKIEWKAP